MDIGVAGTIAVKYLTASDNIEKLLNDWLEENADLEVVDIKLSGHSNELQFFDNTLVIYRKELSEIAEMYDSQIQTLKDATWLIEKLARSLGVDIDDLKENYNNSYNELIDIIEKQK